MVGVEKILVCVHGHIISYTCNITFYGGGVAVFLGDLQLTTHFRQQKALRTAQNQQNKCRICLKEDEIK